ncbi:MAG TPA: HD-GYP domain-containing protein [Candidatus Omnitrophota bacterium]|nr:HD-GYP domain-containing protein [Candidatus Omnitrophota bacterium]HPT07566.1 HD-GYP domain-containing protein [Candidatus Omnitrophota bacterium]
MRLDYKKELEAAAKSMILVRDPRTLIKLIIRMIVQKVKINHADILLHDPDTNSFILTVSRGHVSPRIPSDTFRLDQDNSLIRFFSERKATAYLWDGALSAQDLEKYLKRRVSAEVKQLLREVLDQMKMFDAVVCVPSYFQDDLLGVLLLGNKKNGKGFSREDIGFFLALTSDVAMAIRNAHLFAELEQELEEKRRLFTCTTIALTAAIDAKDAYTHGHTTRVTNLSLDIAKRLNHKEKGVLDKKTFEHLHIASLLHDIGKIGIPETILNKCGPLDDHERKVIQEHPTVGATILQPIKELEYPALGVKYHHERYDGSGYPDGLKGEEIPLIAAIISVADTFDAMATDRPYRKSLSKENSMSEIVNLRGTKYNPRVVDVLVELYNEGKV